MICDTFDIAVVPFPFVEKPAVKRRPALVLSSRVFNEANGHTILAMVTTAKLDQWPDDHPLTGTAETGLVADCIVRWKVFTLPNTLIIKTTGHLGEQDQASVSAAMSRIIPSA